MGSSWAKSLTKEIEKEATKIVKEYTENVRDKMSSTINSRDGALSDAIQNKQVAKKEWFVGVDHDKLISDKRNKSGFDYSYAYHNGRKEIRPKKASVLRFETREGDIVYTQKAKATKGHPFVDIVYKDLPEIK